MRKRSKRSGRNREDEGRREGGGEVRTIINKMRGGGVGGG